MKNLSLPVALSFTLIAGMVAATQAQAVTLALLDTGLDPVYAGVVGRVDPGIDFRCQVLEDHMVRTGKTKISQKSGYTFWHKRKYCRQFRS